MRGAVFLIVVLATSVARGGELFRGITGWFDLPPVTGQVEFGGPKWVLGPGESVDGGWLHSFDLLGYAERIDIGRFSGNVGLIVHASVTPSGPPDSEGWTHYEITGNKLLSTNGDFPLTTFDGLVGGPFYGLHDGHFSKIQGADVPGSPSNASIMPDAVNAGAVIIMRFTWETLDPPYGDVNLDLRIDLNDFALLKANFNTGGHGSFTNGDITGNGQVTLNDFSLLKQNFGWVGPGITAPEPSSLVLFFAGIALAFAFHRPKTHWRPRPPFAARPRSTSRPS